jgi:hypothetical protein
MRDLFYPHQEMPEEVKKSYILLEFTRSRKSCEAIIELLEMSGQVELAELIKVYNKSPGPLNIWNLSTDTNILVEKSKIPRSKEESLYFKMNRKPRGKCIIINNEPMVHRESERFKHVFNELYFNVESFSSKNISWIKNYLTNLSNDITIAKDNALVIIIITHGENENILGYDACLEMEKNKQILENDQMKIADVVKIFSKIKRIPIIFIFDCCRISIYYCKTLF